ncbi:leucyl/phenylalanyl-tRNA--protein transferase [Kordiimonas sp. SCSIO 12603]|uniref:leucyl/phenylalanyl-tRNA--protein transferase n=1 Tax=Kordiimonas sp. SCSIO 12603 TaxID=2829596 RepID=UPI002103B67D|nr:leucyl/phenylalanyl-tRNA--protein transferase [Kordiimonas sp. SCSIO 12603]UTW57309.1 leucyl/phenylalanyl-tRNA--protein transferase [Kordiimonas sp. SCSIO 12603]
MPHETITPNLLLQAYANGIFPMSEDREDKELFWVDPDFRGIIPLDQFHIPRSLKKAIKKEPFRVTTDEAFRDVVKACSMPARGRETTWISERIEAMYADLHQRGFAHSVECWEGEELVGGLYGVSLGAAFFGESMFSTRTNASKIALAYLVARLKNAGFALLDSQFITDHLKQFGAVEIPRETYHQFLTEALHAPHPDYFSLSEDAPASTILQLITQTS